MVERVVDEPPPFVVLVQGPPGEPRAANRAFHSSQYRASRASANARGALARRAAQHSSLAWLSPPAGVGKTTLIRCLVKHYTRQNVSEVQGPLTVVAGRQRRLTFLECPTSLPAMMDAAKVADLVLLLVDGSFGFEMETFEFLNLLQVHGFPKASCEWGKRLSIV